MLFPELIIFLLLASLSCVESSPHGCLPVYVCMTTVVVLVQLLLDHHGGETLTVQLSRRHSLKASPLILPFLTIFLLPFPQCS